MAARFVPACVTERRNKVSEITASARERRPLVTHPWSWHAGGPAVALAPGRRPPGPSLPAARAAPGHSQPDRGRPDATAAASSSRPAACRRRAPPTAARGRPHAVSIPRPRHSRSSSTSHHASTRPSTMPRPHSTTTPSRAKSMSRSSSSSGGAQPVRVDVHERRAAHERRMRPRDHERRALHRSAHAEPGADAARERRLAGAERTGEHHEVAGAQHPPDSLAERLHGVGRGDLAAPSSGVEAVTPTPAGAARAARCA